MNDDEAPPPSSAAPSFSYNERGPPFGVSTEPPAAYSSASNFNPSPLVGDWIQAQAHHPSHPQQPSHFKAASPYANWHQVRQSLPEVHPQPTLYRSASRASSTSSLDKVFEGIDRSASPYSTQAQLGGSPAMSLALSTGIPPSTPGSASLFSPTASLFQDAQQAQLPASSAGQFDTLLAAIAASQSPFSTATPATASTSAPVRQGSATYSHYPSQVSARARSSISPRTEASSPSGISSPRRTTTRQSPRPIRLRTIRSRSRRTTPTRSLADLAGDAST